jgi:hypothetical protein
MQITPLTNFQIKKKLKDFFKGARAGERTQDILISFIFSFHHLTAEP